MCRYPEEGNGLANDESHKAIPIHSFNCEPDASSPSCSFVLQICIADAVGGHEGRAECQIHGGRDKESRIDRTVDVGEQPSCDDTSYAGFVQPEVEDDEYTDNAPYHNTHP